jgi:ssDNA-binding replication factor A large subunit
MSEAEVVEATHRRTLIADLTPRSRVELVRFRVLELKSQREVNVKSTGRMHRVAELQVADESARVLLTVWDNDIESIETGKSYVIRNGYVNEFSHRMRLTRGRSGEILPSENPIETVNDSCDMSRPFAGKKPKRKRERSDTGRTFQGTQKRESRGYCSWKSF